MRPSSVEEIRAFISLFVYRGLLCPNNHRTKHLFSVRGPPTSVGNYDERTVPIFNVFSIV